MPRCKGLTASSDACLMGLNRYAPSVAPDELTACRLSNSACTRMLKPCTNVL